MLNLCIFEFLDDCVLQGTGNIRKEVETVYFKCNRYYSRSASFNLRSIDWTNFLPNQKFLFVVLTSSTYPQ
jgi:hypothetical protein